MYLYSSFSSSYFISFSQPLLGVCVWFLPPCFCYNPHVQHSCFNLMRKSLRLSSNEPLKRYQILSTCCFLIRSRTPADWTALWIQDWNTGNANKLRGISRPIQAAGPSACWCCGGPTRSPTRGCLDTYRPIGQRQIICQVWGVHPLQLEVLISSLPACKWSMTERGPTRSLFGEGYF